MIDDKALEAAVLAYDDARRASHGHNEPAMSERNRETIAPMISAAITAYLSATGDGWRPIATAPKDGASFMLYISEDNLAGAHCFAPVSRTAGGAWWDDSTLDQIEPIPGASHWRPLPAPPSAMFTATHSTAPAAMPSVEEIAKLISGAPFPSSKSLTKARAILALFATILAEKQKPTVALNHWKSRALAAEAALEPFARMDETEFVGSIYEHADDDMVVLFNHATGVKIYRGDFRRASAIRAGGE